ncbi:MAG: hypothetical protein AB7P04_00545 [Bacteriovoracia bacterium]
MGTKGLLTLALVSIALSIAANAKTSGPYGFCASKWPGPVPVTPNRCAIFEDNDPSSNEGECRFLYDYLKDHAIYVPGQYGQAAACEGATLYATCLKNFGCSADYQPPQTGPGEKNEPTIQDLIDSLKKTCDCKLTVY